jgi:hypothetical protein
LPEYVLLAAEYEGGRPVAFYAEDGEFEFLAPLLLHNIPAYLGAPAEWRDAIAPYGYPGPIMAPAMDERTLERFLVAFKEFGEANGIVSAFFRMHPMFAVLAEPLQKYGELVKHGQTVYIDLSLSLEEISAQRDRAHRKDIRRLVDGGYLAKIDEWALFDAFIDTYKETMERVSASEFYFFPDSYFQGLKAILGDRLHLCAITSPDGEIASGALFTTVNGIIEYHLSATANKYYQYAPSKLAFDAVCRWGKEAGNTIFHTGGGVGGCEDSLFRFKAGFSKLRADYYTYRMILNDARYTDLLCRWQECHRGSDFDTDFFPAHRHNGS